MEIDFKITTWERVTIDEKHKDLILNELKNGNITCSADIQSYINDFEYETCSEYNEQMSVKENNGEHTIEAFNEDGETLFQNSEN